MKAEASVHALIRKWAALSTARDAEGAADLYARDPQPIVVFSDGERADDWLDVRVRLQRDFARVMIERIDVHDVDIRELSDDVVLVSFIYDLHARDMWGVATTLERRALMTLIDTKDGYRIAGAQFARGG